MCVKTETQYKSIKVCETEKSANMESNNVRKNILL